MPSRDKASQAKPSQAKPSQAKPSQAKPSQEDKLSHAKPRQGKLCRNKPSHAMPRHIIPQRVNPVMGFRLYVVIFCNSIHIFTNVGVEPLMGFSVARLFVQSEYYLVMEDDIPRILTHIGPPNSSYIVKYAIFKGFEPFHGFGYSSVNANH